MAVNKNRAALILAGGAGKRFWPLSRGNHPKQFLRLLGKRSLLQHTADRVRRLCPPSHTFVCATVDQKKNLKAQLPRVKPIFEPAACNTGPAILLSALQLRRWGYDDATLLAVFPADHYVSDVPAFERILEQAFRVAAETHGLVTLGIVARSAHTGYGYIEQGAQGPQSSFKAARFVEKPDSSTAQRFVQNGRFFWNSGIFVWRLDAILKAFETLAPSDYERLAAAKTSASQKKAYAKVNRLPVDKMILEKARDVFVVPASMGWSDVGSWGALFDLKPHDDQNNAVLAKKSSLIQSEGCLVHAPGKQIALVGVKDLVVVLDGDCVLICDRSLDQRVRDIN